MPYYARLSIGGDSIHVSDAIQRDMNKTYYCIDPKCSCEQSIRAVHSNQRPAHFGKLCSSNHRPGCMAPLIDKSLSRNQHGPIVFGDSSPEALLKLVSAKPDHSSPKKKGPDKPKKKVSGGEIDTVSPIHVNSIKNFYIACKELPLNTPFGTKTIGDIYVGVENNHVFTKFISGIKLVECKFENFNSKDNHRFINLRFPFSGDLQFNVLVIVDDKDEYEYLSQINVNSDYPVLVYTKWRTTDAGLVVGHISSRNQIVFLKKKRRNN